MTKTVAILTAGGLAPCLSSAVGGLIQNYTKIAPKYRIITYKNGYAGLLKGDYLEVDGLARASADRLHSFGGSPIGNSRVKLTNVADCIKRNLVKDGENPLRAAAEQLAKDGVNILHTIGGDDTNTTAADLARFLEQNNYPLTVIGLPKTIDNDVRPIHQTLGAWTAAEQGAIFARNIVAENSANPRTLIIHEIMGRNCGWLTAATARAYQAWLDTVCFPKWPLDTAARWRIHGVYLPELPIDFTLEAVRLRRLMDEQGGVNLFVSEGAGVSEILSELEASGSTIPRDPFGHPKLDEINPGTWLGERFCREINAEKLLVQKSGYFSRSAPANEKDLQLISEFTEYAVRAALKGESGVVGQDEGNDNQVRVIEFNRIAGNKAFDIKSTWFTSLLRDIGQV
jgi:pyrophosphate--fructose-6-phosphate 1-phosphotransferase